MIEGNPLYLLHCIWSTSKEMPRSLAHLLKAGRRGGGLILSPLASRLMGTAEWFFSCLMPGVLTEMAGKLPFCAVPWVPPWLVPWGYWFSCQLRQKAPTGRAGKQLLCAAPWIPPWSALGLLVLLPAQVWVAYQEGRELAFLCCTLSPSMVRALGLLVLLPSQARGPYQEGGQTAFICFALSPSMVRALGMLILLPAQARGPYLERGQTAFVCCTESLHGPIPGAAGSPPSSGMGSLPRGQANCLSVLCLESLHGQSSGAAGGHGLVDK